MPESSSSMRLWGSPYQTIEYIVLKCTTWNISFDHSFQVVLHANFSSVTYAHKPDLTNKRLQTVPDAINLSTQRIPTCPTLTELSWLVSVFTVPQIGFQVSDKAPEIANKLFLWRRQEGRGRVCSLLQFKLGGNNDIFKKEKKKTNREKNPPKKNT